MASTCARTLCRNTSDAESLASLHFCLVLDASTGGSLLESLLARLLADIISSSSRLSAAVLERRGCDPGVRTAFEPGSRSQPGGSTTSRSSSAKNVPTPFFDDLRSSSRCLIRLRFRLPLSAAIARFATAATSSLS